MLLHRAVVRLVINTTQDVNSPMNVGVDGIIIDYPTRLRTVVVARGMRLPKRSEF